MKVLPKNLNMSHVYFTILCVKFNGEIDMVQFIFTQCVAYSLGQKLSLHKKVEKEMKGINWRTLGV